MFNIAKLWKSNKDKLSENQNRIKDLKAEAMNKAGKSSKNLPTVEDLQVVKAPPLKITDDETFKNITNKVVSENLNKFNHDAESLATQINHYLVLEKSQSFEDVASADSLYFTLRTKLFALSVANKALYDKWISDNSVIADKIDRFIDLETDVQNSNTKEDYNELTK